MVSRKRWTHIRVPVELAERISGLAADLQRAYAEGRVEVPGDLCERIPQWYVIQAALDHQQSKRERSRRPRSRQDVLTSKGVQSHQEPQPC